MLQRFDVRSSIASHRLALLAILLASLLIPRVTPAQRAAEDKEPLLAPDPVYALQEELAGVRAALDQIATHLARLLEHQEVQSLMARLQIRERRTATLENEQRSVREQRATANEERRRLEGVLEEWERDNEGREPDDPEAEAMKGEMRRVRRQIALLEQREADLDQRLAELNADLSRAESEIRRLTDIVDERLGLN